MCFHGISRNLDSCSYGVEGEERWPKSQDCLITYREFKSPGLSQNLNSCGYGLKGEVHQGKFQDCMIPLPRIQTSSGFNRNLNSCGYGVEVDGHQTKSRDDYLPRIQITFGFRLCLLNTQSLFLAQAAWPSWQELMQIQCNDNRETRGICPDDALTSLDVSPVWIPVSPLTFPTRKGGQYIWQILRVYMCQMSVPPSILDVYWCAPHWSLVGL
jgi:hypothetical protein